MRPSHRAAITLLACLLPLACAPSEPAAGAKPGTATVTPVSLRYGVEGMHCDGCVQAITDKVTHVDGVLGCSVSLQEKRAEVSVRDASLAPAVQQAIERLGYKVTPQPAAPTTTH